MSSKLSDAPGILRKSLTSMLTPSSASPGTPATRSRPERVGATVPAAWGVMAIVPPSEYTATSGLFDVTSAPASRVEATLDRRRERADEEARGVDASGRHEAATRLKQVG